MKSYTPREIVAELDRFIIGQQDAKRAVAIALRNRWRRQQLTGLMREEVLPKNILMIGPTGCGKTEIARRLAKMADAPFIKVEATKFTEVGYVGRDVEQIIRDLVDLALHTEKKAVYLEVEEKAKRAVEERILDAIVGLNASIATREAFRERLRSGVLAAQEIELDIEVQNNNNSSFFDIPGMPGAKMGAFSMGDMLDKMMGNKTKKQKMTVEAAYAPLLEEESEKLIDQDKITRAALRAVEENGIVFLDEIDKICAREGRSGADISREGVQRDLLPLIEGTNVSTKHGNVKTDHILFIASGAFHVSKPADLLPELQGRLPIRVELNSLSEKDFRRILTETEASLLKQYTALLDTEGVTLSFSDSAVDAIAKAAFEVNRMVENIGARRLQTILERILDEISFDACEKSGEIFQVEAEYVEEKIGALAKNADLSRFIL